MDPGIVRRPPFGTNPTVGERGSDTRRRVLESALELFAEVPYPEARVEQITERAGCSRPAFYQYFSSKEDVFWTLATQLGEEMVELANSLAPVTPDEDGLVRLTAWVDDLRAEEVIRQMIEAARTGRMGDGKIFVLPASAFDADQA